MTATEQQFRWPAYNVIVFVYGGLVTLLLLLVTSAWWLPNSDVHIPAVQLFVGGVVFLWTTLLVSTTVGALYGYWRDARTPLAWIIAHLLVGPFAAIYYLYRRGKKRGNDCTGLWITAFPDFTEGDTWTFLRV